MMASPKPDEDPPMFWRNCGFWLKFVVEERIIGEGIDPLGHEHE
jgi:hypothetical protein